MTPANEPLVSILIPVYNCETYLAECLESITRQTYRNWECVVVNNCSTDRTPQIAAEFAARDSRIRVHTNKEFVRAVRNHNNAFEIMSPEARYCKLVQADDWIYPECVEKMVAVGEQYPNVGLIGAYGLLGDTRVTWFGVPYRQTVMSGRDAGRMWLAAGDYPFGSPTATMIRADIVRSEKPFWDEGSIHADTERYIEFLRRYDFGFVHQVLTFTRVRDGLTSHAKKINSNLPSVLGCLTRYGDYYLSSAELTERIRRHLHNYYDYLAKNVGRRRGADFWKFHKNKLQEFGWPYDRLRLSRAFISLWLDRILNPKRTIESVIQGL